MENTESPVHTSCEREENLTSQIYIRSEIRRKVEHISTMLLIRCEFCDIKYEPGFTLMCHTQNGFYRLHLFLRRRSDIFIRENFKDFCGLNVRYEVLLVLNKFWFG